MRIATWRLVGDSVGMVLHGLPSTLGVTMEMMILHGRAVVRGLTRAMPIIDMPFGSYEESPQQAYRNAARLMVETGAPAVKLEGGVHMAETIAFLTRRGVPVMAHIGLTPQAVNTLGGYKVVGREGEAAGVMADARGGRGGRGLCGGAGKGAGGPGGAHHADPDHPDHRHRRWGAVRRAGAGGG